MKSGICFALLCLMAGVLLWMAIAPCLSAAGLIPVDGEFSGLIYCTMGGFPLMLACLALDSGKTRRSLAAVAVFFLMIAALVFSDRTFTEWKLISITSPEWLQMVEDCRRAGVQLENQQQGYFVPLPESLNRLGNPMRNSPGIVRSSGDRIIVTVMYGPSVRRWGLVTGCNTEDEAKRYSDCSRVYPVATNSWFCSESEWVK